MKYFTLHSGSVIRTNNAFNAQMRCMFVNEWDVCLEFCDFNHLFKYNATIVIIFDNLSSVFNTFCEIQQNYNVCMPVVTL